MTRRRILWEVFHFIQYELETSVDQSQTKFSRSRFLKPKLLNRSGSKFSFMEAKTVEKAIQKRAVPEARYGKIGRGGGGVIAKRGSRQDSMVIWCVASG